MKEELKNKLALGFLITVLIVGPIICYQKVTNTGLFKETKTIVIEIKVKNNYE
jgi:hypothetical protein